jgi:hypothetical protein
VAKFIVRCESGFCGVDEILLVNADTLEEAEEMALAHWTEMLDPSAKVMEEINPDNEAEYEGYEEI